MLLKTSQNVVKQLDQVHFKIAQSGHKHRRRIHILHFVVSTIYRKNNGMEILHLRLTIGARFSGSNRLFHVGRK